MGRGRKARRVLAAFILGASSLTVSPASSVRASTVVPMALGFIRVSGAESGDLLGIALAISDLSGDGKADLIIGGGAAETQGAQPGPGYVQVILNRADALVSNTASLPAGAGFKILAEDPADQLGRAIAPAGDVNGDGLEDLIVSARAASPFGRTSAGAAYVIFGAASTADVDLATLPASRGFQISGAGSIYGARSVAGVGDVNGDGFDDVAVGSPSESPFGRSTAGRVHVIFGGDSLADIDLAAPPAGYGFAIAGGVTDAAAGKALAGGDINGDGFGDVIVVTKTTIGRTFVVFGGAAVADIDLASFDSGDGFWIDGVGSVSLYPPSAAAADVDGDGYDEVILGMPSWHDFDSGNLEAGAVFVIRGGVDNPNLGNLVSSGRVSRLTGAADHQRVGVSVGAGDLDDNGRADLATGGPTAEPNGSLSGSAWVVQGTATPADNDLGDVSLDWSRIDGSSESMAGYGVAIGDVTGDGVGDLAVGAPGWSPWGLGSVSVFRGSPSTDSTPPVGSVSINAGASATSSTGVTVKATATDSESVVSQVALSNDGVAWTERPFAALQPWTIPAVDGTRTVYVKWQDYRGNWSAPATDTIILDRSPPIVSSLRSAPYPTSRITNGWLQLMWWWYGADALTGVRRYEVELSTDGGPFARVGSWITSPWAVRWVAPWHTYRLRVRAIDSAGNVGQWATGAQFKVVPFQDSGGAFTWAGAWSTVESETYWAGSMRSSTMAGASASVTVTGSWFGWVGALGPTRGKASVYVDAVRYTIVDLYAASGQPRALVYGAEFESPGTHTITIVEDGVTDPRRIDVDAIVVGK